MSRLPSQLPESSSLAVLGGGLIGMSIALEMAGAGWHVAVFERGRAGGEASWAGAGMLSPGGEVEGPSALAELAIESRNLYRAFVQELEQASGLRIDYQECGGLDVAYSEQEAAALEARAAEQHRAGIASKSITAERMLALWPRLRREGLRAGRFYPNDAIVNPREMTAALAAACRSRGVTIVEQCAVRRVAVGDARVEVETTRGEAAYEAAVIAAGAWSSEIAVEGVRPIPRAEPVKGHLIGYRQPEQTSHSIVRQAHTYLLQRANGLLIVGASVEYAGFDREVRAEQVAELARRAALVFPHLGETEPSESWIGFRPGSDALHMEAWDSDRLYLAYGHFRNGILLAPVTARRVAKLISANLRKR